MIIVSQDKRNIINYDFTQRIGLDRETNFESIVAYQNGNISEEAMFLGHYETEERAKEVLQEIYRKYEHGTHLLSSKSLSVQNIMDYDFIYEMPKE